MNEGGALGSCAKGEGVGDAKGLWATGEAARCWAAKVSFSSSHRPKRRQGKLDLGELRLRSSIIKSFSLLTGGRGGVPLTAVFWCVGCGASGIGGISSSLSSWMTATCNFMYI